MGDTQAEMLARLQAGVSSRKDRRTLERMAESGKVDPLYLKAVASQAGKNVAPVRMNQFQGVLNQINKHIQEMEDFKESVIAEVTFMRGVAKFVADSVPAMQQILIEKGHYTKEELEIVKERVMKEAHEVLEKKRAEDEAKQKAEAEEAAEKAAEEASEKTAEGEAAAQESNEEGNDDVRSELGGTGSGGSPGEQQESPQETGERPGDEAQEGADSPGEQGSQDAGGGGPQAA